MQHILIGLIICIPAQAPEAKTSPIKARYEALLQKYDAAEQAWLKQIDAAADSDPDQRPEFPAFSFAPRFLALAETDPDDPASTDALLWVVNRAMNFGANDRHLYPHYRQALDQLAQGRHIHDPRVGRASTQGLRYASAPTESFLRLLIDRSRNREVRGRATLALGTLLLQKVALLQTPWLGEGKKSADEEAALDRIVPEFFDYLRKTDVHASEAEAEILFEQAIKDYADVEYHRAFREGDPPVTIGDGARSALHELRDLAIGKLAPEIEGEDIQGKPLKLSDYRGKVVVLTFWATWCGPCMQLVPHERALVKRLADKPFVLLGINADEDRDKAKQALAVEKITWRSWWNGGPSGPISELYNVEGWPTVYVLDAHGVIRHKQVLQQRLDQAVNALLKEME